MSITLNDEQEKALREWYNMGRENDWRPWDAVRGVRLSNAIAPLMEPWRWRVMEDDPGVFVIIGPKARLLCFDAVVAGRACHFLNKGEAKP